MAARLASLPATISATPIFAQMEKHERMKRQAESTLAKLEALGATTDEPAEIKDYLLFLKSIRDFLKNSDSPKVRTFIVRTLVKRIHYTPEAVYVNFMTARTYVDRLLDTNSQPSMGGNTFRSLNKKGTSGFETASPGNVKPDPSKILGVGCSNTLTNGGP